MPELAEKLTRAVVDDPPLALKEGGIFRDGYDVDLDALRQASREGKNWISQLQEREIGVTGIKSLKVRYNSVFGDRKSTRLNSSHRCISYAVFCLKKKKKKQTKKKKIQTN